VLVIGAGVAGLQAIATARRIGAVVEAFDTRPVVKEQVQSLGATFIELGVEHQAAQDAGGYAKELSEDHIRQEKRADSQARDAGGRNHHDRSHPRKARACSGYEPRTVAAMRPAR
jgi:NAD/NADP transhydrogenase alpha subunit